MRMERSGGKLPGVVGRLSSKGLLSILLGLLAILTVGAQYELLMYFWSGYENPVLQFIYIGLPLVAIVLAARAYILGREEQYINGPSSALGVIGVGLSVLAFLLCFLLFGWSCFAGGKLIEF